MDQIESIQEIKVLCSFFTAGERHRCQSGKANVVENPMMVRADQFYGHTSVAFDSKVFDFELFDHLTMGEVDLQVEVIELFRMQIMTTLEAIGSLKANSEWIVLAHTLKGAAAAVGATQIVSLAQNLEANVDLPGPGLVKGQLGILAEKYFAEAYRVLEPHLKTNHVALQRMNYRSA